MRTPFLGFSLLAVVGACSPVSAPAVAPRSVAEERPAEMISARGTRVATARPPSLVQLRGRQVLVYEIIVAPPAPLSIDRIDVLEGSRPFASVDAAGVAAAIDVRGADNNKIAPVPSTIAAGQVAVVYMFHEVPPGRTLGDQLLANVSLRYGDGTTEVAGLTVPILPVLPVVLGAPMRSGPWLALNGLSNKSHHRRVIPHFFSAVHLPERYAIDYSLLDAAGELGKLPGTANEDYNAFGKELLAVGDGIIRLAVDGRPDITPGALPPAATATRETILGNTVSLALDGGGFVLYAHMKLGTVRVKIGDRVKKGDVLGLLGNSGNTSAPHLHLHVTDRLDPLESEGVPFVFESFSYVGQMIIEGTGGTWSPRPHEPQTRALPAENEGTTF
jgi:hypothetical protein